MEYITNIISQESKVTLATWQTNTQIVFNKDNYVYLPSSNHQYKVTFVELKFNIGNLLIQNVYVVNN